MQAAGSSESRVPFANLTDRGKARRLRKLLFRALAQYDIDVGRVRYIGIFTNTHFRVDTACGSSYIARICTPGWRTETDLKSEVMWLQALSKEVDIGAPHPLLSRTGDLYEEVSVSGVPESRRVLILSWIPGTPLGRRLTEANLFKMGVLFARLHRHAAGFVPPDDFTDLQMDGIYARGEENILFSDSCQDAFTPQTRKIFELINERVQVAFANLYGEPTGMRVIHNDLWHNNIKIYRGNLHPLDFEDTIWGYPVQDIAMALQDLMLDVPLEMYGPLENAFRAGYESIASWPERDSGQIDTFRAGRMIWVANYVARFQREYLRSHVEWTEALFKRFLETGRLQKG